MHTMYNSLVSGRRITLNRLGAEALGVPLNTMVVDNSHMGYGVGELVNVVVPGTDGLLSGLIGFNMLNSMPGIYEVNIRLTKKLPILLPIVHVKLGGAEVSALIAKAEAGDVLLVTLPYPTCIANNEMVLQALKGAVNHVAFNIYNRIMGTRPRSKELIVYLGELAPYKVGQGLTSPESCSKVSMSGNTGLETLDLPDTYWA